MVSLMCLDKQAQNHPSPRPNSIFRNNIQKTYPLIAMKQNAKAFAIANMLFNNILLLIAQQKRYPQIISN